MPVLPFSFSAIFAIHSSRYTSIVGERTLQNAVLTESSCGRQNGSNFPSKSAVNHATAIEMKRLNIPLLLCFCRQLLSLHNSNWILSGWMPSRKYFPTYSRSFLQIHRCHGKLSSSPTRIRPSCYLKSPNLLAPPTLRYTEKRQTMCTLRIDLSIKSWWLTIELINAIPRFAKISP